MTDDGRSMRERMLAGDWYRADDPELTAGLRRARDLSHRLNATHPDDREARHAILRELLGAFGERSEIRSPFHCDYGSNTFVGSDVFANFGLVCLDVAPITIGDHVQIGPYVQLLAALHPLEAQPRRELWEAARPITIGDNVWLGGGAIVLPGVSIGADSVIGAGAVVTRDIPPGVVAVGNPARVTRELPRSDG